MKILLEMRGGSLDAVTADGKELEVLLRDWDNERDPVLSVPFTVVSNADMYNMIDRYSISANEWCIAREREKVAESLFQNLDLRKLLDLEDFADGHPMARIIDKGLWVTNDHSPDDLVRTVRTTFDGEVNIKVLFNSDNNEVMAAYVGDQRISVDDYKTDDPEIQNGQPKPDIIEKSDIIEIDQARLQIAAEFANDLRTGFDPRSISENIFAITEISDWNKYNDDANQLYAEVRLNVDPDQFKDEDCAQQLKVNLILKFKPESNWPLSAEFDGIDIEGMTYTLSKFLIARNDRSLEKARMKAADEFIHHDDFHGLHRKWLGTGNWTIKGHEWSQIFEEKTAIDHDMNKKLTLVLCFQDNSDKLLQATLDDMNVMPEHRPDRPIVFGNEKIEQPTSEEDTAQIQWLHPKRCGAANRLFNDLDINGILGDDAVIDKSSGWKNSNSLQWSRDVFVKSSTGSGTEKISLVLEFAKGSIDILSAHFNDIDVLAPVEDAPGNQPDDTPEP